MNCSTIKMFSILTASLMLLLNANAYSQEAWPVSDLSKKIEFTGIKKWPSSALSEEQRKLFLRQWYWNYLTQIIEQDSAAWLMKTDNEITVYGLPANAIFERKLKNSTHRIFFSIKLIINDLGVNFKLNNFELVDIGEDYINTSRLEDFLGSNQASRCLDCQQSLIYFREKIDKATVSK